MRKALYILLPLLAWAASGKAQKPVFDHAALYVTDLPKSLAFYRDVVGLDTLADPFRDGQHAWLSLGAGMQLHLVAGAPKREAQPQNHHLSLRIPSVESFLPRLAKAGVPYVNARGEKNTITTRPDGVQQVYFQDPDGYWIEINDAKK